VNTEILKFSEDQTTINKAAKQIVLNIFKKHYKEDNINTLINQEIETPRDTNTLRTDQNSPEKVLEDLSKSCSNITFEINNSEREPLDLTTSEIMVKER
jgi:hypothetical protein